MGIITWQGFVAFSRKVKQMKNHKLFHEATVGQKSI